MRVTEDITAMIKAMNRIASLYVIVLIIISPIGCKTIKKEMQFAHKVSYSGITNPSIESSNKIDKEKTYEIYFTIEKDEKCLKLTIQSIAEYEGILKDEKIVKTYFIVEKAIDISRFAREESRKSPTKKDIPKIAYSEIGKNFDHRWNRKRDLLICTSIDDPIKKLNTSKYRIRFTTFMKDNFSFTITAYSNQKITFMEKAE